MQLNASHWAPCFAPVQSSIKKEQRKSPAENGSGRTAGCNLKALMKSMPLHILSTKLGGSCLLFTDAMIYTQELCELTEAINLAC